MYSSNLRSVLWIIGIAGLAAAGASHPSNAGRATAPHGKPARATTGRRSIDPPVPAQGKLGQDLFLAIDHRDLAEVNTLLKRGADPNARNGLEFRPIYIAAASHQTDAMKALLDAGAKPDAASGYGTALMFAAQTGNVEGARLLLSRGANVNDTRVDGITVLMMASRAGSTEIVGDLLKRNAEVNATDGDGATPLIYAAREGQMEASRALLDAGAKVDGADSHRWTPLMYAAVNGHTDVVRLLLEKGAHPNARDAKGRTPLLLAATYGDYPEVDRALLDGGADVKAASVGGHSAAALAAARGYTQTAALLGEPTPSEVSAAGPKRAPEDAVRASLKLIQSSMLQFNKAVACISCHQDGLGRVTTAVARERGLQLDPAVERAEMERINGALTALRPLHLQALKDPAVMKQVPLIEINEVGTGDTWLLAGMAAQGQPATEASGAMAMVLARQQTPDGDWGFTLPRVPMQSSFFTTTALAVRSLKTYGPRAYAAETAGRIQRAKAWLLNAPAKTSEDRASRLLGLKWAGASEPERRKAVDEVRADQRPDGGWSQLADLQSDAYATGQALYALHVGGGLPVTDPVYRRGMSFLLRTQEPDGSWFVNKRAVPANNYFDAGFPHGESQYSSFNGTCWATMALLQTIDPPQRRTASRTGS